MQLIPLIILTSAAIVGAHISADELAYTVTDGKKGIGDLLPRKLAKPIITCVTCMASVWGASLAFKYQVKLDEIPVFILAVAFTNTLFNRWVS